RAEVAHLVHDLHEMAFAGGVVVRPRNTLPDVLRWRPVAQPHERKAAVVRRVGLDRNHRPPPVTALGEGGGSQQKNGNQYRRESTKYEVRSTARDCTCTS